MGLITRPTKIGGNTTYVAEVAAGQTIIRASEVDGDFSTIYAAFNGNVSNANVAANAAIVYSKLDLSNSIVAGDLTAGSVTTDKIADLAVTAAKLSTGISQRQNLSGVFTAGTHNAGAESSALVTVGPNTFQGGPVQVHVGWLARAFWGAAGGQIILRVKTDGVTSGQWIFQGIDAAANSTDVLAMPFYQETPSAGSHTYTATVQVVDASNASQCIIAASIISIIEWA